MHTHARTHTHQLRRAIIENEEVSGRLTASVSGAEVRLYDLHTKLQGHRRSHAEGGSVELVESLFQTGVLELENMELEQTTRVQVGWRLSGTSSYTIRNFQQMCKCYNYSQISVTRIFKC